jgi:GAF domain-containing protein/anti-sigma regulatory factor (Ser/Thr protein kinase)
VPSITLEQLRAEAHDDEHFALMRGLNIHSVMVVPMFAADRSLLGAVTLIAAESMRTFTSDDLAVADRIAKRAEIALQTAYRFEQQRRIAERLQLLEAATQHVYDDRALNVAEMGRSIARAAVPALADRVSIYLREQPDQIRFLAVYDVDEQMTEGDAAPHDTYPLSTSALLNSVIEQNRPRLVPEVDENTLRELSDDAAFTDRLRRIGLRSFLIVPLRGASGPFGAIILSMCRDTVRRFSEDDIPVAEELAARTAFAIDLAIRNERDRRVSQTFQRAALPAELPRIPGIALSAWYEAGGNDAQVGGDWYDAFRLPDGRLVLSIGDVAGSGLDAAVIMGSVRQSIRTAAIITPEPRLVLDAVDRVVRALGERFVTAFVAIFDPLFGELRYASAGHAAALLRTPDGNVEELRTDGLPLGLRNLAQGETKSRALSPRSQLLLFTDGLSEVDRDIVDGERRIRSVFGTGAGSARGLFTAVMGSRQARDDVAIIVLTFECSPLANTGPNGAAEWTFQTADSRAGTDVRRELRRFLRDHGLAGDELDQAEIVSGELIGNAVRYAPGNVRIIADASGALPVLHVIDEGPGWELNPRLPADLMSERGRGLFIINALVEEMSISRRTDGTGSHARVVLCTVAR